MSLPARYPGACANTMCPGIHPGDEIETTAAWPGYVHVTCPKPPDPLAVERPPCPRCFTVPTPTGMCLCD